MGLGSYDNIGLKIVGHLDFTYGDNVDRRILFRRELELLCARYGLQIEEIDDIYEEEYL